MFIITTAKGKVEVMPAIFTAGTRVPAWQWVLESHPTATVVTDYDNGVVQCWKLIDDEWKKTINFIIPEAC